MEGYDFPEPKTELLLQDHAVNAMRKVIMESKEPVTIVPIAAMTNIALLFALYPEVKSNIREIVMMGGSVTRGNKGVMSEFNVATDRRPVCDRRSYSNLLRGTKGTVL